MGIYVRLAIVPQNISPKEWAKAYEEVRFFLEECPYDLMGLGNEKIGDKKRVVFTHQLQVNEDSPKKCRLYVIGDFQSRETGESFIMYKNLNVYCGDDSVDQQNTILVSLLSDRKNVSYVFDDKTQGYPYHIPMLAAAMIVEDRFPNSAYVSGDINLSQAKKAQLMLKDVLKRDVALPICTDAERLFKSLQTQYQGATLAAHFEYLFRGSSIDAADAVHQLSEPDDFVQWFIGKIKRYRHPTQLGVIDCFVDWLSVTKDLPTLCHLACIHQSGPQFNHLEFASALASTWISVVNDASDEEEGTVDTVGSQLGSVFLDMGGFRGRKMRFYMEEKSVLDILGHYFPKDLQEMEKMFLKETEKLQASLTKMRDVAAKRESIEEDPEKGDGTSFLQMNFTTFDQLSLEQQKMLNWIATSIGRIRNEMHQEVPTLLNSPAKELKAVILEQAIKLGVVLAEGSWDWIDHEEDLELLKVAFVLLFISSQGMTFCNLRVAILENRKLCQATLELSRGRKANRSFS